MTGAGRENRRNQGDENMDTNKHNGHPENCNCQSCKLENLINYFSSGISIGPIHPDRLKWDGNTTNDKLSLEEHNSDCFEGCRCRDCRKDRMDRVMTYQCNNGQYQQFGKIKGVKQ